MHKFSEDVIEAVKEHVAKSGFIIDAGYGFSLIYIQDTKKIEIEYNKNNCLCAVGCLVKKLDIKPKQVNYVDLRDYLNNLGDIIHNLGDKYGLSVSEIYQFVNGFDNEFESDIQEPHELYKDGCEVRKWCLENKYL